jgi:hypothetical protein
MAKVKWMTYLDEENWKWMKALTKSANVTGGAIINLLLAKQRQNMSEEFKEELVRLQHMEEYKRLSNKLNPLVARREELAKKLKGVEV